MPTVVVGRNIVRAEDNSRFTVRNKNPPKGAYKCFHERAVYNNIRQIGKSVFDRRQLLFVHITRVNIQQLSIRRCGVPPFSVDCISLVAKDSQQHTATKPPQRNQHHHNLHLATDIDHARIPTSAREARSWWATDI